MLFSDTEIVALVQGSFEPVWESVRAVPTVTLDFGEGRIVRRTLHGNIATYVVSADGEVLDVIAGMNEAPAFRRRLEQGLELAAATRGWPAAERARRLAEHHAAVGAALAFPLRPDRGADLRKRIAELPTERIVSPVRREREAGRPSEASSLDEVLAKDTRHNQTVRRRKVHAILSAPGPHRPADLTRRIYRDVLGTDLDDPYLGLGGLLFDDYPFVR